jgi:hypothetical protein
MRIASAEVQDAFPGTHGAEPARGPALRSFALAAAAPLVADITATDAPLEVRYVRAQFAAVAAPGSPWHEHLPTYLRRPQIDDVPLLALARELGLTLTETLALALAAAVEDDLMVGRALAYLQAPVGGSRPTLGLVAALFAGLPGSVSPLHEVAGGAAQRTGALSFHGDGPLPELALAVPAPLALALRGIEREWPDVQIGTDHLPRIALPESIQAQAARHARALATAPSRTLAIRSGSAVEAKAVACAVAAALKRRAAFVGPDRVAGLGPWLSLRGLVPVFGVELAPGEHRKLPPIPGYRGPLLAVCGLDGTLEADGEVAPSWRVAAPEAGEREALWVGTLGDREISRRLAREHRHSSGRIAELGRAARHLATFDGRAQPAAEDVLSAARVAEPQGLGALAAPIADAVPDSALVVTAALRDDLQALAARCRVRDALAEALGPAARIRYHPGVRALFVGPSGTGKTLAASWLATRLGMPLYRIDLAAVTSKYIGETEKNLSQLIARAEHAEVVLLFDEADSLFGKRTDVKDSNDRFANAQTNYLLQRIESFDGIAILTSNSRARFDAAFTRRLDAIIEFPLPGPEERRELWIAHLGAGHGLSARELNQIAASVDLAGGHIRNAVLRAAADARAGERAVVYADLVRGIAAEYRKLGRQAPPGLEQ